MNNMWNTSAQQNNTQNMSTGFLNSRAFSYGLPHYEIIEVNGEEGARSIKMAANSSIILADKNNPIVWFAQTDGAGYLTVTPYDVVPHQVKPPINIDDLAQRVSQLEEIINARQSNSQSIKQVKKQQSANSTLQKNVETNPKQP